MKKFRVEKLLNQAEITTATSTAPGVIVGPVDVSGFERFCLQFQNANTAIGFLDLRVEAGFDIESASFGAGSAARNWNQVNSAIIPVNSALGASSTFLTSQVNNVYQYLRVVGATSQTAAVGTFRLIIAGVPRE